MTYLYYERYKETCFARNDILAFKDVLQCYGSVNDNELVLLIKRHSLRIFNVVRSLEDEHGASCVYCHEFDIATLSDDHEIKSKILLRSEVENLAKLEPFLKLKRVAFLDFDNSKSEISNLKEEIEHLKNAKIVLEKERDELLKKLSKSGAIEGTAKKTASRWAVHVETAVTLAVHCVQNPDEYTEPQLQELCKKLTGNDLAREALAAFRKALPSDLIQGRGRPRAITAND